MPHSGERIYALRKHLGMTLEQVARRAGTNAQQIHRLEQGDRRLDTGWIERLAKAFGCEPSELLPGGERRGVPVIGMVGERAEVRLHDAQAMPEDAAPPAAGAGMAALRVCGDAMQPMMQDGWLIYYADHRDGVNEQSLNRLSVVECMDGAVLVKLVKKGYRKGVYNLLSPHAAMMEDVALRWAQPVLFIRPA